MEDKITGYVHYAKYKKDDEILYFEHADLGYDYEVEYRSLHSEMGQENLNYFLKSFLGATEIVEFGLKEVKVDRIQTVEGIIGENGGQTPEEFAVMLNREDKEDLEIEDWLQRIYMDRKVRITIEFLD